MKNLMLFLAVSQQEFIGNWAGLADDLVWPLPLGQETTV